MIHVHEKLNTKVACNKKIFTSKMDLNKFKEETSKGLHVEHSSIWC